LVTKKVGKAIDEPLSIYLKEIQDYPLLSKNEEIKLAKKIKKGDKKALDKLIA